MKEFELWLRMQNLRPIKFYPYTSGVTFKILKQDFNYKTEEHDFLENLGYQLKVLLEGKVNWDNKVVVECEILNNPRLNSFTSNIFIGCYDGMWSVGLGVWSDDWIKPKFLSYE